MPRRERDREIARRRKRRKESKKLRAKSLLAQGAGSVQEGEKKKPEKATTSERPPEGQKEVTEPTTPEG
jgi:hypothetical protein